MSFSKITFAFRKSVFPSHFVAHRVPSLQLLRNSRSVLLQSFSRTFINSGPNKTEKGKSALKEKLSSLKTRSYSVNWSGIWGFLVTSGIVYVACDNIYVLWVRYSNERRIYKALETGTQPQEEVVLRDKFIPRSENVERLKEIFEPNEDHSYYHIVCGEHGAGKTTLIKKVAREVAKGVIYVNTPADVEKFGKSFGKALNLKFEEDVSITARLKLKFFGGVTDLKWKRALDAFGDASEVYKAKHGKPPVIVYDNISRIAKQNPEILDILQDDAKDYADKGVYIAVFVSSEGSVPRRMESRSAWSRAKQPVIEIGDLSEKESMEYLTKKRKINEVEAKKLYELVGGLIIELKSVADDSLAGKSFEVIKQSMFNKAEKKLQTARLLPKDPYYELGRIIFSNLKESNELSYLAFKRYFDRVDELNEVLGGNVFAYHPVKNTVTFQCQSVKRYILENGDIFLKK